MAQPGQTGGISDRFSSSKTIRTLLDGLGRAGLDAAQTKAAQSALNKMSQWSSALASADSLESALEKIMAEQSKSTDQRCELAKSTVLDKFDKLRAQNLKEQKEIQKRIEAADASGFWGKLVDVFKGLGAALSAASAVFTGPAGIAAAALLIASLIVSYTVPGDVGKYLSLGLAVAGTLCGGLGGTLTSYASSTAARLAGTATTVSGAACEGVAAGGVMVKGYYDSQSLEAQAALMELKTASKKLLAEAEEEREELKLLLEAQDRGVQAVVKSLESHNSVALLAIDQRRRAS